MVQKAPAVVEVQQVRGAGGMDFHLETTEGQGGRAVAQPFCPVRLFAVTIRYSFLLLLSAGISPKTWPCSRKTQAGRRASQTGSRARSAH